MRKKKALGFKKVFFGGLFFCLIIGLIYFFIFSPFFWVEKIEVEIARAEESPLNVILKEESLILVARKILEEKILGAIPRRSIFLISTNNIRSELLEAFPEIRLAVIAKKLPSVLKIKVVEREPVGIYCQQALQGSDLALSIKNENKRAAKRCFYLDNEGIIYRDSLVMEGGLILIIYDEIKNHPVRIREKVIFPEVIDFILTIKRELAKVGASAFVLNSIEDMEVITSEGWRIYFNLNRPASEQLEILGRVLDEEIGENKTNLEYIDLRAGNRVYYR